MDAQRWSRLSELFENALDLSVAQRQVYIVDNCAKDSKLEDALRRMLAADTEAGAGDFLEQPLAAPAALVWPDDSEQAIPDYVPGSRQFGPYRLLRLIGQGGMGQVHLAERSDGEFEQRVALKLLPHPTPGLMQRFRQERQILARLEHANIARLLDGGVGADNVPYFAMEYVDGEPIARYASEHALDVARTLQMFLYVCDAVQYAHRSLVVHRDLKPSNILVTADGVPKLLDFGIAKLLQVTGDTQATRTAARAFTPDYAAPEQIRGEAITTATDVYALGVVLYELLVGRRPYSLSSRNTTIEQAILDNEPSAPSAAFAHGDSLTVQRRRELRGDLDRIVLTALAKEPERRYSSAEALAADIRCYLNGRPIAARGDSKAYRVRKFIRRNRIGVSALAIIALVMITATTVSLTLARNARNAARRAEEKSQTAEAVKNYLLSVFTSANPYRTDGKTVTARDLLEGGLANVDTKLAGEPRIQAEIDSEFTQIFVDLDQLELASQSAQRTLDSYRLFSAPDALDLLNAQAQVLKVRLASGNPVGVAEELRALLARVGERGGDFIPLRRQVLHTIALAEEDRGEYETAAQVIGESLRLMRTGAEGKYDAGQELFDLARVRLRQGRVDDAEKAIAKNTAMLRASVGPQHPDLINVVTFIGRLMENRGRIVEASELFEQTMKRRTRQFGAAHAYTLRASIDLAQTLSELRDVARANALFDDAIARHKITTQHAKYHLIMFHYRYGLALTEQGRLDEAQRQLDQSRTLASTIEQSSSPEIVAVDVALADIMRLRGDAANALLRLTTLLQLQRQRNDLGLPRGLLAYARASSASGRSDDAEYALDEALDALARQGRSGHPLAVDIEREQGVTLQGAGQAAGARAHYLQSATIACAAFGCTSARVTEALRMALSVHNPSNIDPAAIERERDNLARTVAAQTKPSQALYDDALAILLAADHAAHADMTAAP